MGRIRTTRRLPSAAVTGGYQTAMGLLDYFRVLRRRWWALVVGLMVGLIFAMATQPSQSSVIVRTAPRIQYRATHLLISDPNSTAVNVSRSMGYDRLALLTIAGDVPRAVLKQMEAVAFPKTISRADTTDAQGNTGRDTSNDDSETKKANKKIPDIGVPKFRLGKGFVTVWGASGPHTITAIPDPPTGALAIVVTGGKASSVLYANAFAEELTKYLDTLGKRQFDARIVALSAQLDEMKRVGGALEIQILQAGGSGNIEMVDLLQRRRFDNMTSVDQLNNSLEAWKRAGPAKAQLNTLEAASEERLALIVGPGGTMISPSERLLMGGGIGLFLALALVIVLEVLSSRVRDVAGTEGAARMPVVAEIPVVAMDRVTRFTVATATDPASLTAEAYRSLRTSLLAMWQRHPKNSAARNGNGNVASLGTLRTLLVTSPGPAEGKSITAVNLAAAFAETGVSVIVIDADFRRPTMHRYFATAPNPNLGDIDVVCTPADLEAVLQETGIPGVRMAASAPTKSDPGHAIAVAKAAVLAAKEIADLVILDSPPILLANDAADLALGVDATLLLARCGWTRRNGVASAADLLRRLEATVIGVVIVGAEHGARAGYYGYYGYYGYGYGYAHPGEVSVTQRLLPWKAKKPSPRTKVAVRDIQAESIAHVTDASEQSEVVVDITTVEASSVSAPTAPDTEDPWI